MNVVGKQHSTHSGSQPARRVALACSAHHSTVSAAGVQNFVKPSSAATPPLAVTRRTSSRAGQLPRLLPAPPTLGAVAALFFMALPAHAGGLGPTDAPTDPCPETLVLDGTMTGQMLDDFAAIRSMSCPVEFTPPVFIDRKTGRPLTDEEKLARIFNGSSPHVPEVPLPATVWGMLAAILAFLGFRRKPRPHNAPTQAIRRVDRRTYERTHAALAREMGRPWPPRSRG